MPKHASKRSARKSRAESEETVVPFVGGKFEREKFGRERAKPPLAPLNRKQAEYIHALRHNPQVLVMGPAGTGKTWIAATYAADLYRSGAISKIILTRPNVPCGRTLGFFPGTLEEKFQPWAAPIVEALQERLGKAVYDIAFKRGDIEMAPFEVARGRSWKNAFVLLDEAQNTTVGEIKMFLTRIGEGCVTVVNGDVGQSDLGEASGLSKMIDLIRLHDLPVPVIEFTLDDIVRSDLCAMWARAFETPAPLAAE